MDGLLVLLLIYLAIFWLIAGYAIASRRVGHEAALRNLPFVILITLAFAFVPLFLGERSYTIFLAIWTVFFTVFNFTYLLSWHWRRRQAGSLILDLGRPSLNKSAFLIGIVLALFAALQTSLAIETISKGVPVYSTPDIRFSKGVQSLSLAILYWSLTILFVSQKLSRLQLRENGICYKFIRMDWHRITSYVWDLTKPNVLIIWFKPRFPLTPVFWSLPIPAARKDEVDRILADYLPGKFRA